MGKAYILMLFIVSAWSLGAVAAFSRAVTRAQSGTWEVGRASSKKQSP